MSPVVSPVVNAEATAPERADVSAQPSVTPRGAWQRSRVPLAIAAVLVLAAALLAILGSGRATGADDPDSYDRDGAHALAALLGARGIDVRRVAELPQTADPATTLVVPDPSRLSRAELHRLRSLAGNTDVVVATPAGAGLGALDLPLIPVDVDVSVQPRDAGCPLPAAGLAGRAVTGGTSYAVVGGLDGGLGAPPGSGPVAACYHAGGQPTIVTFATRSGSLTVLGDPAVLRNRYLDREGNAALALGLVGTRRAVAWVFPRDGERAAAGSSEQSGLLPLLPRRLGWAAGELGVVVLLLLLWRGRRLGPVVTEQLPVVVRAAETVEGRARLYRSGRARSRTAEALRTAARADLVAVLGLGPAATSEALVAAVSARTGRATGEVAGLLYGAATGGYVGAEIGADVGADDDLVRLADDLDTLRAQLRAAGRQGRARSERTDTG